MGVCLCTEGGGEWRAQPQTTLQLPRTSSLTSAFVHGCENSVEVFYCMGPMLAHLCVCASVDIFQYNISIQYNIIINYFVCSCICVCLCV